MTHSLRHSVRQHETPMHCRMRQRGTNQALMAAPQQPLRAPLPLPPHLHLPAALAALLAAHALEALLAAACR